MSKIIYERIFNRLIQLGIDPQNPPEYAKSRSKGFMDLNFDLLHKTTDCMEIALSHNFEQSGDLVPDPDMQIRVYPATKMAEALTYQDQFGYRECTRSTGR
jgi:tryptophanyl-tRNA synthetase